MMAAIPGAIPFIIDDSALSEEEVDKEKFNHCIHTILKVFGDAGALYPDLITNGDWENHPVLMALDEEDVETFSELLAIGPEGMINLIVPEYNDGTVHVAAKLPGKWTRKLHTLVAYYHHESRKCNWPIDIWSATVLHFHWFRIGEYSPEEAIIPWNRNAHSSASALSNW